MSDQASFGPPNNLCQPTRVEGDRGSGYSFEFDRVYAEGAAGGRRGTIRQLDRDACYWQVRESKTALRKRLTFATALKKHSGTLTFERFSSLTEMRDDLLGLFA